MRQENTGETNQGEVDNHRSQGLKQEEKDEYKIKQDVHNGTERDRT